MPIKTTLIFPGIAGRGFNSLKQGMDAGWISHGLASLSAAAKAAGFEVDLIDLRALSGWDCFREVLAERDPDVIGVTMMSVDYNPARRAIAIAKELKPGIVTVIGGPHVTIALEDSFRLFGDSRGGGDLPQIAPVDRRRRPAALPRPAGRAA